MIKSCVEDNGIFGVVGNEFIKDKNIPSEVVSVYAIMRTMLFDINRCCSVFTMQTLYDLIGVDSKSGSKSIKPIQIAIEWLIDNGYIELYDVMYGTIQFNTRTQGIYRVSYLLEDQDNVFFDDGGFTRIPEINMFNLLQYIHSNKGIKKYQLIRYYLVIARQCSNDSNFGSISMKRLCDIVGISEKTCADWNILLKRLGLIDFNNEYGHVRNDVFKMDCTMYGHYNIPNGYDAKLTEDMFEQMVNKKVEETSVVKVDKEAMASKKSIAAKKMWEERKRESG